MKRHATWQRAHGLNRFLARLVILGLLLALAVSAAAFSIIEEIGQPVAEHQWYSVGNSWHIQTEKVHDTALTVRSVISIGRDFANGAEALHLAGLGTKDGVVADALRLVWAPDPSGWGFVWSLQLQSDIGLLPPDPRTGRISNTTELAKVFPAAGHAYETLLSYDSATGGISIAVTDLHDGKSIYKGGFAGASYGDGLWPTAGLRSKGGEREANIAVFESLGSRSVFLPIGSDWVAATASTTGSLVPARRFDLDEEIIVRLTVPGVVATGEFRLVIDEAGESSELGRFVGVQTSDLLRIPADQLPLGEVSLRLEYVDQGEVLLSETRLVTIGHAVFRVSDIAIDREKNEIRGLLQVSAARHIEDIELSFEAIIREQLWEQAKLDYRQELYGTITVLDGAVTVPGDGLQVPFALPLPPEPGLYELTFQASAVLKIGTETIGGRKLFTTYQPANPQPGEPYAIAVLPDTQNVARSYPTIYIRQLQWIAEQAAERNIMLMLHVGDITNDNIPLQWQRSVEAITLLDDVMPYVLAQGNHDMPANGGGDAADRESTLINRYFPVEKQPWIGGTFEPGRIENSYSTFDLQGDKYLVVSLEFGPRNEVLDWANEVVAAHPEHQTIMVTHVYTARSGGRSNHITAYPIATNPNTTVNGGSAMWTKFVSRHANMFMTLSGHHDAQNAISRQVARGLHGNSVYEIMTNYQFDVNGGNGFFPLFEFFPDGTIEVQAYSPYLDAYRYDISDYGFDNHFIIDTNSRRYLRPVAAVAK